MSNDKVAAAFNGGDGSLSRTIEAAEIRGYACGHAAAHYHIRPEASDWAAARRWAGDYGYRTQVPSLPQFSLKDPFPVATHEEAEKMVQDFVDRYPNLGPSGRVHIWSDAEWTDAAQQARTEMRMRDYVGLQVSADAADLGPLPIEDQAPVPGPTGKQLLFALGIMALIVLLVSLPGILGRW